ncbi:MAG: ferritin [Sandaracinaceae bacterium]|nr:ferritin [Sandaracinaceae bacterium]
MAELHEPREHLSDAVLDMKRAIDSMREELEAVDWYRQRMNVAADPELRAILQHHQREEVEHFAMLLEWCRRNDADFAEQLRTYLFTERPILEVEEEEGQGGGREAEPARARPRPTLGSLRRDPEEPR